MDYRQSQILKIDISLNVWIGAAVFFIASFYLFNMWLLEMGVANELLIYFGEKTEMAYTGNSIDDIFFISPILPYTLTLLLRDPFLVSSIIGGISLTCWLYVVNKLYEIKQISGFVAFILAIYLLFSPSFLFLFSQKVYSCLFMSLIIFSAYSIRKYYFERLTYQLFFFGISLGLIVQNTLENMGIIFAFLPAIIAITLLQKRPLFPVLIVALLPSAVFVISPMLLNGLFYGNFGLSVINDANVMLEDQVHWYFSWLRYVVIVPYFLFFLRIPQFAAKSAYVCLLILPLLIVITRFLSQTYVAAVFELMIFILFSILLFTKSFGIRFEKNKFITFTLFLAFSLSFAATFLLTFKSPYNPERIFVNALLGYKSTQYDTAKQIAEYLKNTKGKIATDDRSTFAPIYFSNLKNRFVVPTQPIFKTVLSQPSSTVDYILINNKSKEDAFLKAYGNSIPGFDTAFQTGEYTLYERKK